VKDQHAVRTNGKRAAEGEAVVLARFGDHVDALNFRFPAHVRFLTTLHDQLAKTVVGNAIDADIALPFEGEAESDVKNSFLVVDRRRDRAIRIELYRKQYDQ
jgi:hypothetical protein